MGVLFINIIQKLSTLFRGKNLISHSNITKVSTKYGLYSLKAYKDQNYEYLTIMSRKFSPDANPIVYIHSESHECEPNNEHTCYCNNQMDVALRMINKEGGVILFTSADGREIDSLLKELNTRKLSQEKNVMYKDTITTALDGYEEAYNSLGYIFTNLKLSTILLISNDEKVSEVAKQLNIIVPKQEPNISYQYGVS